MYKLPELETYKTARTFRIDVTQISRSFPKEEQYNLTNQLIRSCRSISANIAEGYGRYHYQENIQFCRQARGSLFETFEHLTVAFDERYISEDTYNTISAKCEHLLKLINGYISYLKTRKAEKS